MRFFLIFSLIFVNSFAVTLEEFNENKRLAEKGDPIAQTKMGHYYYHGVDGITEDYEEAAKWYRKAAEQGSEWALARLGLFYERGLSVPVNYVEAYAYFNVAGAKDKTFAAWRDSLAREKMTREQITEGQKRSMELQQVIDSNKAPLILEGYQSSFRAVVNHVEEYWLIWGLAGLIAFVIMVDFFNPANLKVKQSEPVAKAVTNESSLPYKNKFSYFSCWWKTVIVLLLLRGLLGYLNSGTQGMAIMLGSGFILSPLHALWIAWIWWYIKK